MYRYHRVVLKARSCVIKLVYATNVFQNILSVQDYSQFGSFRSTRVITSAFEYHTYRTRVCLSNMYETFEDTILRTYVRHTICYPQPRPHQRSQRFDWEKGKKSKRKKAVVDQNNNSNNNSKKRRRREQGKR